MSGYEVSCHTKIKIHAETGHYYSGKPFATPEQNKPMNVFLSLILWSILLVICWPVALVMLFLFPLVWLILLPFRIVGLTLDLVFKLVGAILMFPFRVFSKA